MKKKGSSIHTENIAGNTPLHLAVMRSNYRMIQLLLEWGANSDQQNRSRETPIHLATQSSPEDQIAILQLLLNHKANPDIQNKRGLTALHLIMDRADTLLFCIRSEGLDQTIPLKFKEKSIQRYRTELEYILPTTDLLLKNHAAINIRSAAGLTPMDYAENIEEEYGHGAAHDLILALISLLEKHGAISGSLIRGEPVVVHPDQSEEDMHKTVLRLIKMGGRIDAPVRKHDGLTYLHLAAMYGYYSVAQVLIEADADVNTGVQS